MDTFDEVPLSEIPVSLTGHLQKDIPLAMKYNSPELFRKLLNLPPGGSGGSGNFSDPEITGRLKLNGSLSTGTELTAAFGDSLTFGWFASSTANGYTKVLSDAQGWTAGANYAVPDSLAADQFPYIYARTVEEGDRYTFTIGINDDRKFGANTAQMEIFRGVHLAEVAWLAIPHSKKILGTSSAVTYTGTWNDSPASPGRRSHTLGSKASFKIFGANIVIGILQGGATGTAKITIDGAEVTDFSSYAGANMTTYLGIAYGPRLLIMPPLTNTEHTVEIEVTSNGGETAYVYFDWAAAADAVSDKTAPQVFVGNISRQTAEGYANFGGSLASTGLRNQVIRHNIETLVSLGLNVTEVNLAAALDPDTDMDDDGIHWNDSGHARVAAAFDAAANGVRQPSDRAQAAPGVEVRPTEITLSTFGSDGFKARFNASQRGIGNGVPYVGLVNNVVFLPVGIHISETTSSSYYLAETKTAGGFAGLLLNRAAALEDKRLWGIDAMPSNDFVTPDEGVESSHIGINAYDDDGNVATTALRVDRQGNVRVAGRLGAAVPSYASEAAGIAALPSGVFFKVGNQVFITP